MTTNKHEQNTEFSRHDTATPAVLGKARLCINAAL